MDFTIETQMLLIAAISQTISEAIILPNETRKLQQLYRITQGLNKIILQMPATTHLMFAILALAELPKPHTYHLQLSQTLQQISEIIKGHIPSRTSRLRQMRTVEENHEGGNEHNIEAMDLLTAALLILSRKQDDNMRQENQFETNH